MLNLEVCNKIRFKSFRIFPFFGSTPAKQEIIRIFQLPDIASAPMSDRLSGAEPDILSDPFAQGCPRRPSTGLAYINYAGIFDPVGLQFPDRDIRIPSLEMSAAPFRDENWLRIICSDNHIHSRAVEFIIGNCIIRGYPG